MVSVYVITKPKSGLMHAIDFKTMTKCREAFHHGLIPGEVQSISHDGHTLFKLPTYLSPFDKGGRCNPV